MPKSSQKQQVKPAKPYKDFPLYPHATRRWAKKIRGRVYYFGKWDDPMAALEKYQRQSDDLHAGRVPRDTEGGLELRHLANHFLSAKQRQVDAGELQLKTFGDYHATATRLIDAFGVRRLVDDLRSDNFGRLRASMAKVRGPVALGNEIQRVRTIFKYGYDAGLLDKPIRFGPEFKKPSAKNIRQARQAKGERMFSPYEIHRLLATASVQMKAMILLAINAGFGNTDLSELPRVAVDLNKGMINFPRPKTAIARRVPLWQETITALCEAIKSRPKPKNPADHDLVFITKYRNRWVKCNSSGVTVDSVCSEFTKLLQCEGLKRPGISFYALRHVHRTIADEVGDNATCDLIMGHENTKYMATRYRERIDDSRLRAVTDHVHTWLFR